VASNPTRSTPELELENTPSGEEEADAFLDLQTARGDTYDEDVARSRIDLLARLLAAFWTTFLWYIIIAQGMQHGWHPHFGRYYPVIPAFHLEPSEFIAVVTTTTVSVFGFLVIVARYLFKK